jgi:hypothetical protein
MKEVLGKLSSYNLFNYLFPGVLFAILVEELTHYSFIQSDLIIGAFLYYFIGLVVSRFGSLIIEPFFKKIRFLEFADYKKFVAEVKKDSKIEILSEVNNMYRTLASVFILLLLLKIYELLEIKVKILSMWTPYILIVLLLVMFLFSYKKQAKYITKRVKG